MKIFNKLFTVKEEKEELWNGDFKKIKIINILGLKFKMVEKINEDIEQDSSRVKFIIAYHMPAPLFKNSICIPVHLGRKLARKKSKDGKIDKSGYKWMLKNMIGDDTGKNISEMNRNLNEMTGIYWAWKNYDKIGSPEYIGFMHYRSLFNFSYYPKYKENFMTNIGYTEYEVMNVLKDVDFISGKFIEQEYGVRDYLTNYYNEGVRKELFEKVDKILQQQFGSEYEDWLNGKIEGPYKNMFVTKREIFFDYCNWIFPILFRLYEDVKDYKYKNQYEARALGYIAETLTGFFFYRLSKKCSYKELPIIRPNTCGFIFKISEYKKKYVKYRVLGIFIKKYKSKAKLFKQAIS